ncbi:hypothetical protein [Flavobacterium sp.]|uniref:hypothetical protein n=1 Tax=Flavobacterium sp. TaxID=239 RepID=UPI002FDA4790
MKKLFLCAFMLVGLAFSSQAQQFSKNALGLRLGDNDGFGGEISYQRGLSKNNRLELDLGWRNSKHVDAYKLVGLYQWVWDLDKGFNWYAGVGGGIGSWSYDYNGANDNGTIILAAGDIGIEYNFAEVPLQLSLDFRPELYLNNNGDNQFRENNFGPDIALGIRYRF